jgi:hypothetical protein
MPKLQAERAERIIVAVLENIGNWQDRVLEIADNAIPVTGNKARALSLARDLEMAKHSLRRLAGLE